MNYNNTVDITPLVESIASFCQDKACKLQQEQRTVTASNKSLHKVQEAIKNFQRQINGI